MESSLRVQSFEQLPSSTIFTSQIESSNVPALLHGCVKDWKAMGKWNPATGGLDYLQERVGSSNVEAMLSRSAPVFNGDLRSHERVQLPFSTFIGFCKDRLRSVDGSVCASSGVEKHQLAETNDTTNNSDEASQQIYLAQVPIANSEDQERVQLEILKKDIQVPIFLEKKEVASINLWMNSAQARSSTHYDPHHNMLCIVAGRKQVVLWPPSASPYLYPMPIYGEASNHSAVAVEHPDYSSYPRAKESSEYSQKVILHAGDALFIPEGWFHQVDSDDLTIAVNFWWKSNIMSSLSEHMDAYYLRIMLRRLVDREMNQELHKASSSGIQNLNVETVCSFRGLEQAVESNGCQQREPQDRYKLHELDPFSLQALHELVSLVHDRVNVMDKKLSLQPPSTNDAANNLKQQHDNVKSSSLSVLEDDSVAKILWTLKSQTLRRVLLVMAQNFPRTLEAMILHLLSAVGAEVLTRKFEEMDQQTNEEDRNTFYQIFYGAFDDQSAAMEAILNGKESFALQAFRNVLDKYLGVKL